MNVDLNKKIREFQPTDGCYKALDPLLTEALADSDPKEYYDAFFYIFEQYPNDDGDGVFWTASDGMEKVGDFQEHLLSSFQRAPSEMTQAMLTRLYNSGVDKIGTVSIPSLLDD